MQAPDVHYARSADGTHIAYQVAGDGPIDVLMVSAAYSNIELIWTLPSFGSFLDALASIATRHRASIPGERGSPTR